MIHFVGFNNLKCIAGSKMQVKILNFREGFERYRVLKNKNNK